ncbi:MAG: energy-coupling factor transporter transmembrane protein EcfT [Actinobacteria bacterium]|nr:energy-coupling factor transporter transmembrane protein EcfT [Actinomycetota bacterium]
MASLPGRAVRLARPLHPGAWWLWALGMATAASRTTNPLLLALIVVVVAQVVGARRGDAPWARGFKVYLVLGLIVIGVRVGFRVVLDGQYGAHVLFTLPQAPLPAFVHGVRIGGPVSAEGVLGAAYDGLRLATLLICVGAANVLADPRRLLKAVPPALHEAGVAVTVALTVAPQLIESGQRVRRTRRLRGESSRRFALVRTVLLPVLMDALDRSLLLAAAMDAKGYGHTNTIERSQRVTTAALMLGGLGGICCGVYGLLDGTAPRALGVPMLVAGAALAWTGLVVGGRRVRRSRYRPDPWRGPEWIVAATGVAVAAVFVITSSVDASGLIPSLQPLRWPELPVLPALAVGLGLLPAWLAPPVQRIGVVTRAAPAMANAM